MAQGQRITEEEWTQIQELLKKGIKPRQMTFRLNRSSNAIYAEIKRRGVKISDRTRPPKREGIQRELSDEPDFSQLPDHVLFNPRMFPSF